MTRAALAPVAGLAAALTLAAGAAQAGEVFAGAYDHDVHVVALGHFNDHGAQLSLGYRTDPLTGLHIIGSPSLQAFGAANTSGGVNYGAAGLSWKFGDRLYLRPGIGVAIHDGHVGEFQVGKELNLGSRVLAELELGVGWQFSPKAAIEASFVHLSHGQLAGHQNPGLDDVGLRFNYRF